MKTVRILLLLFVSTSSIAQTSWAPAASWAPGREEQTPPESPAISVSATRLMLDYDSGMQGPARYYGKWIEVSGGTVTGKVSLGQYAVPSCTTDILLDESIDACVVQSQTDQTDKLKVGDNVTVVCIGGLGSSETGSVHLGNCHLPMREESKPEDRSSNLRLIEPDPKTGQPLRVHTSCGSGSGVSEDWAMPISVYADSDVRYFVDQKCVIASALTDFGRQGKYSVDLYTFYKGDAFCRIFATWYSSESRADSAFMQKCHSVIYRSRRLSVDTRNKTMLVDNVREEDSDGRNLGSMPGDIDWHPISDLDRDPRFRPLRVSIDKITDLVREKSESKPKGSRPASSK